MTSPRDFVLVWVGVPGAYFSPMHLTDQQPSGRSNVYVEQVRHRVTLIGDAALTRSAALYFETTPGRLSFLASSVVLGVGEARFLVTAGHALDEALGKPFYAAGESELVQLAGKWVHSRPPAGGRNHDHIDLGLLRLNEAGVRHLALGCVFPGETDPAYRPDPTPISGTYYICVGFPKGKQTIWMKDGMLNAPKQIYLTLKPGPSPEMLGKRYNFLHNLALEFETQAVTPSGEPISAPHPVGMSGGGVWACDGLVGPGPQAPRLVGISTTWLPRQKAIMATRIGLCFDGIVEHFPELADELPSPS